jgi:hypothetical protein
VWLRKWGQHFQVPVISSRNKPAAGSEPKQGCTLPSANQTWSVRNTATEIKEVQINWNISVEL